MRLQALRGALVVTAMLATASAARAVTVTVSEMHLCCRGCTSAVEKAIATVEGARCKTSEEEGTTVIEAPDLAVVQNALDAMAAAGFTGTLDTKDVKFAEIKTPEGKVKRLAIFQIHNCCGACTEAIKGALAEVEGVSGDTCKAKEVEFVIEGDFSAKDAVDAMLKAGFYLSLEPPKEKPKS